MHKPDIKLIDEQIKEAKSIISQLNDLKKPDEITLKPSKISGETILIEKDIYVSFTAYSTDAIVNRPSIIWKEDLSQKTVDQMTIDQVIAVFEMYIERKEQEKKEGGVDFNSINPYISNWVMANF